jgi:hypothetical protein
VRTPQQQSPFVSRATERREDYRGICAAAHERVKNSGRSVEVAPGFRTLTRRDPCVCGPVGEDVLDGHEQEKDIHAGVSP